MIVRHATAADIPELLRMGRAFCEASHYREVGFDESSVRTLMEQMVASADALLLIADAGKPVGMLGALRYPFYMNRNHPTVQELFWWVDESERKSGAGLSLIAGLEQWSKDSGAKSVHMGSLDSSDPERIEVIYKRRGYKPSERIFIKVFQ